MEQDRSRWDERYRSQPIATPRPPDVLVDAPELLAVLPADGVAVDIACGAGAQSLWLADRGFAVVALDISSVAIELTRAAAADHDCADRIDARVVDLDDGLPIDLRDVSVVVCQRFRGRGLYGPIVDVLRPNGIAVITVLSAVGLDGRPGEFHAPAGELREAFTRPDTEVVHDAEAGGLATVVVRKLAPMGSAVSAG